MFRKISFLLMTVKAFLVLVIVTMLAFAARGQLGSGVVPGGAAAAQARERVLQKKNWEDEPVEIVSMKSRTGQSVRVGAAFREEGDDWLRGLEGTIKNTSNKPIRHLQVGATVWHPATNEPVGTMLIFVRNGKHNGWTLPPGETVTLRLPDGQYKAFQAILAEAGLQPVSNILLAIDWVEFTDGTAWRLGQKLHPDPSVPDRWVPDNPKKITKAGAGAGSPIAGKYGLSFTASGAKSKAAYNCASLQYL